MGTVAVIGDVVESRGATDQARLLAGLSDALEQLAGARSAAPTVGDEFQAIFDDLHTAVGALARLRLRLLDEPPADHPIELRIGIGVGEIVAPPGSPAGAPGQSGPGWWAAREALDRVAGDRRPAWPPVSWWVAGEGDLTAVRATLVALDSLATRFDGLDVSLARGVLSGESGSDLARRLGMTKQSVSSRLHHHGVYGWVRTLQTLTQELA